MSKFRARQLDASKPISIYYEEDINDSAEFNNVTNRTVPQLPTGMEKEEETEHHLQQAIFHHRVIPVPEVYCITQDERKLSYDCLYPPTFKSTRQMVHIHPFSIDQDIPDYDMDSSDEDWLNEHTSKGEILPLDPLQFEEMMDRLEKASGLKAVTLQEAKYLLKDDDDLITAVYDYWLNKRLRLQHPLLLQVRSEKGVCGSASTDPYVAFRKRTEKMQTRKNRKTEEQSYEKMLKLKRDLFKAVTLLEMLKRREKSKRELLHLNIELFEKRYLLEDFNGSILSEVMLQSRSQPRNVFAPLVTNHQSESDSQMTVHTDISSTHSASWIKGPVQPVNKVPRRREEGKKERRPYKKKRRHATQSSPVSTVPPSQIPQYTHPPDPYMIAGYTRPHTPLPQVSEDDDTRSAPPSDEETADADGFFTFKRKAKVCYLAAKSPPPPPLSPEVCWGSSCSSSFRGGSSYSDTSQFHLTSVREPKPKLIGWSRRRVGRGGRVWLDRLNPPPLDERLKLLDQRGQNGIKSSGEFLSEFKNEWPHFTPSSPSTLLSSDSECDIDVETLGTSPYGDFCSSTLFLDATVLDGSFEGTTTPLQVTIPANSTPSSYMSGEDGGGGNSHSTENPFGAPSDNLSEVPTSGGVLVNYKNSSNASATSLGTVKKKSENNKWMAANVNSVNNSTRNYPLSSSVSKASTVNTNSTANSLHSTHDFHTQPSSKFSLLDVYDNSLFSNHNSHHQTSSSKQQSRAAAEESLHLRMNSSSQSSVLRASLSSSLSSSIASSSMLVKNISPSAASSSFSSSASPSFSHALSSPSPSPKNKRDNILTQPESASKKSSSSSGSLSSFYVQRDFDSSKPSFILSNSNKNNGNAASSVMNNSSNLSNLVSQKLLTWTKGEIGAADSASSTPHLSNGPSSKLSSNNTNKRATKLTQIIFPES